MSSFLPVCTPNTHTLNVSGPTSLGQPHIPTVAHTCILGIKGCTHSNYEVSGTWLTDLFIAGHHDNTRNTQLACVHVVGECVCYGC